MIASLIEQLPFKQRKEWITDNLAETKEQLNKAFRCMAIGAAYYADQEEDKLPDAYDSLKYLDEIISDLEQVEEPPSPKKKSSNNS